MKFSAWEGIKRCIWGLIAVLNILLSEQVKLIFLPLLQVYSADLKYHKTIEGRTSSISTMRLHLQSSHFGGGNPSNGLLILRCTAQIGNYYNEYTEKELSTPQKDPIPARGE